MRRGELLYNPQYEHTVKVVEVLENIVAVDNLMTQGIEWLHKDSLDGWIPMKEEKKEGELTEADIYNLISCINGNKYIYKEIREKLISKLNKLLKDKE